MAEIRKIKDQSVKKQLIEEAVQFKQQLGAFYSVMAEDSAAMLDNVQIAKLNDLAYRAVRTNKLNKMLDERTIRNEA